MKTPPNAPGTRPARRRGLRGQAMVEYSMITWLLAVGLILGSTVKIFPAGPQLQKNVIELFLDAYQIYYDSFYFALNMPFP